MTDLAHYSTFGPVCPLCGHKHQADEPFYYDEEMTSMDCEACERNFDVRVYTSTSWSTFMHQAKGMDRG